MKICTYELLIGIESIPTDMATWNEMYSDFVSMKLFLMLIHVWGNIHCEYTNRELVLIKR